MLGRRQKVKLTAPSDIAILKDGFLKKKKDQNSSLAAQSFRFRGDKYIMEVVRVFSLAHDMHTCPPLHPYQI